MMTYDYLFKYIMVGDPGVGKTCLMLQLIGKRFGKEQKDPLGEEFGTKFLKVDDLQIKLQVWDDLWSLRYKSIPISFYRPAAGVIIVYDVTQRKSFNNAQLWIQEVKAQGNQTMIMILVGNKTDLESMRQVTTEEGQQLAKEQNILFIETSAKTGDHVDDTFIVIAKEIIEKLKSNQIDLLNKVLQQNSHLELWNLEGQQCSKLKYITKLRGEQEMAGRVLLNNINLFVLQTNFKYIFFKYGQGQIIEFQNIIGVIESS